VSFLKKKKERAIGEHRQGGVILTLRVQERLSCWEKLLKRKETDTECSKQKGTLRVREKVLWKRSHIPNVLASNKHRWGGSGIRSRGREKGLQRRKILHGK